MHGRSRMVGAQPLRRLGWEGGGGLDGAATGAALQIGSRLLLTLMLLAMYLVPSRLYSSSINYHFFFFCVAFFSCHASESAGVQSWEQKKRSFVAQQKQNGRWAMGHRPLPIHGG